MSKTIVITGASDGVGAAAARQLHAAGHRIVIVGRSPAKTTAIANELGAAHYIADFSDLTQVRTLAQELSEAYPTIDVLANNAGGIMGDRTITSDGNELTFQVNHLAPFLLTTLLLPTLTASKATVIQTASRAARVFGKFDIEDLQNAKNYAPHTAYGNGKLENILFTSELQRRYGNQGINAVAFHPGIVATQFAADTTHLMRHIYHGWFKRFFTITPEQGADQLVWLAQGTPEDTFTPGAYYEERKIAQNINPDSLNPELARSLWEKSEALVKTP